MSPSGTVSSLGGVAFERGTEGDSASVDTDYYSGKMKPNTLEWSGSSDCTGECSERIQGADSSKCLVTKDQGASETS